MPRDLALATGLLLGGFGYLALAWYVWRYRAAAGGRGLLALLLAVFCWTSFYAVELNVRTVEQAEVWSALKFFGVVAAPPALLAFALEYTGRRGLRPLGVMLLAIEPVLVLVSFAVPATRELLHRYDPAERAAGVLDYPPVALAGPLFWPHAIYNYALVCLGLGILVVRLARIGRPYRRSANAVIVGVLLPLVGNLAYNLDLLGEHPIDPVPFLFSMLAGVLVWGFFRVRLLDLVPVARGMVLEQMLDGVLVLDAYDRVVDANPAAAGMLDIRRPELVGRYLGDVLPPLSGLLEPITDNRQGPRWDVRLAARTDQPARDLAVSLTPLTDRGAPSGRLVVLHDVTERQMAQRRLHELLAEQTRVAETLQAGLRPTELPSVPGVRMAARSLPASTGGTVSGDFYDVHRVLGGDWAFVLGDVSGKGVEAAVVTSMARYTVRTLSAEGREPAQVLEQLNRALLTDDAPERFCTVVYGRLDGADLLGLSGEGPSSGLFGPRLRLSLVLGGHPRPLVRRRTGEVEAVGRPGTALGLVPRVDVQEVTVDLGSGDVLLAFTDGVTEARRGVDQFGEERLAEVFAQAATGLLGRTGPTVAGLVAEAVAERVVEEVTAWAKIRDDVAVLVVAVA